MSLKKIKNRGLLSWINSNLKVFKRLISQANEAPKMPACDFEPKPYKGPAYENTQTINKNHILSGITPYYKTPLLVNQGHMQWLFDHTGKRYLDMFGGIVTVSVGHCHPKVNEAVFEQMKTLWHTTNVYLHPKLSEYVEKLVAKLPGDLKVVYFVNSGSEANDLAMLLARVYTQNFDIISFRNGYHGTSPYCMGLTALSTWKYNIPSGMGIHHALNPDVYRGLWGGSKCRDSPVQTQRPCNCDVSCAATEMYYEQLEQIFRYSLPRGKVAGIFCESIQGVGGTLQFPRGFIKKAYELIRSNGGICIADEVQTGFGRTGDSFWGFESHKVTPDIVTVAKGIGNGYPLAAVITTPKIAEALGQAKHFNTFGGNPVACAAGIATLEVIEEENLQNNSKKVGTHLLNSLAKLRDEFEIVGDVRGKGLMIGVELVNSKATREPLSAKRFADIWENCKDMGVLIGQGGFNGHVLRIKPPMCISKEDADFSVEVLRNAIKMNIQRCSPS